MLMTWPEGVAGICIDGRSGVGKSTLARRLSCALDAEHFDSGALYRLGAFAALRKSDPAAAIVNAEVIPGRGAGDQIVLFDGNDVTADLWTPEVNVRVPIVASVPAVRQLVNSRCRTLFDNRNMVLTGRDVGGAAAPDGCRLFVLECSDAEREARLTRARDATSEQTRNRLESRVLPATRYPNGTVRIDTSAISADQVFEIATEWLGR